MIVKKRYGRETGREYALRVLKENIVMLELEPGSRISENVGTLFFSNYVYTHSESVRHVS